MEQLLKWEGFVFHHTWSNDNKKTLNWPEITKYHTSWRYKGNIITPKKAKELIKNGTKGVIGPWRGNGYNFGIEKENYKYVIVKGRPLNTTGAHTVGKNDKLIGIAIIGNFDIEKPTDELYGVCAELCYGVYLKFPWINPLNVHGHREFANKSCPGNNFNINNVIEKVREKLSHD